MMTKPAAKRPKAPPGSYTRKAHEVRAKAAKQTSDVVTAALEWCLKEKKGSKAAEHSGLFPGVTYNMIEPRLKKLKKKKTTPEVGLRSHHAQLLTDTERVKVGKWIAGCADGHCPKDRSQISQKIIAVLKARHKSNKQRKHGVGTVALNQAELDAVSAGGELSHRFFQRFYRGAVRVALMSRRAPTALKMSLAHRRWWSPSCSATSTLRPGSRRS